MFVFLTGNFTDTGRNIEKRIIKVQKFLSNHCENQN